ncbi:hypothetical protein [Halodesulfovibrio spirochaetisodalis]|uniref:Uncharacterized protein n=1 Tax=Halodesulfovibrio spirochaetisodalis TaxID=1560234 RepID=A0A1B7XAC7_9BACT|nr:hypothetical protein [Halodesulfovibrio spirochaetisodalis]OBQ46240.1 hypothetical protein SP90_13670 [Halodesulfovibrio spirochaetisodalis]
MFSLTLTTSSGICKVDELPAQFSKNLAYAPRHLKVAKVNGKPVTDCCDTCGRPICQGDSYTTRNGHVWCNTCLPQSN